MVFISSLKLISSKFKSSIFDSSLDKFTRSLTKVFNLSVSSTIMFNFSSCFSFVCGISIIISAYDFIIVSGVLRSCDTLDINSLLKSSVFFNSVVTLFNVLAKLSTSVYEPVSNLTL